MEGVIVDLQLIVALVLAFLVHWVADFPCQNDKMALNKSHDLYYLALHCLVYSVVATIGLMLVTLNFHFCCWVACFGILFLTHSGVDAVSSKVATYFYKNDHRAQFFNTIGFDQFLHISIIMVLVFASIHKVRAQ